MEKIELEKLNEVYFGIPSVTTSQSLELKEHFSCKMPNFWFHPKAKANLLL